MGLHIPPADVSDPVVSRLATVLTDLLGEFGDAEVDLQRSDLHTVSVRVVDCGFVSLGPRQRHDLVWGYFSDLSPEVLAEIGLLEVLAPAELADSPFSDEFRGREQSVPVAA